jgi:uncharacterized protein YecE (DUF72 family)
MIERLHVGTSGWSYKHWSGIFYPEDVKPAKYLEHYVTVFDCVELNASFYRMPNIKTVQGWARRTPASFRFCAKMSRFITHQKKLVDETEPLDRFLSVFHPLSSRIGPFLVQLPPGLRFDPDKADAFFHLLASRRNICEFALEARHDSWFAPESVSLLKHYGIANVIADPGGRFAGSEVPTNSLVYLRFHGPDGHYHDSYTTGALEIHARKIFGWLSQGCHVWAFFNNDFNGHAVHNARELKGLIEQNITGSDTL